MKIYAIGDPHGNMKKIRKIPLSKSDLILITGDIGKADLARKMFFKDIERVKRGLSQIERTPQQEKQIWGEIYNSTIKVLKHLSKFTPVYSLIGNIGAYTDAETKKRGEKLGIKLSPLRAGMKKIKNFHLVRNNMRNIDGLRIGFLEFFVDTSWAKEFGDKDILKIAKKETDKAKKILKRFGKLDILLCHQPPLGFLDKVGASAPKQWRGKHAGSKVILDYIKKKQPKYVFCGHIHESKGNTKIGKSQIYNLGVAEYTMIDLK